MKSFNGHASTCICTRCDKARRASQPSSKPWAAGFNGHARSCECSKCIQSRVLAFKEYYKQNSKPVLMPDETKTVFVRPHWRRQKNHLKHYPKFKKALINSFI